MTSQKATWDEVATMAAVPDHWLPDPQQGVFETLLVQHGRPVELGAHLARLEASLEELYPDRIAPQLNEEIEASVDGVDVGAVRATVAPRDTEELRAKIELRQPPGDSLPLSRRKAPIARVALQGLVLPGGLGAHKWADRSLLDEAQSRLPADTLPLLFDGDGTALEASRANVFAVRDDTLFTPPPDGRILPGITRTRVLKIAAAMDIDLREVQLKRDDLLAADEVFLTGSVRGIEQVRALDGITVAQDGGVATHLAAELRRAWLGAPVG
jgi:para-aminobenzoate synthetase/4-amino-4-deoxychorismate lyase